MDTQFEVFVRAWWRKDSNGKLVPNSNGDKIHHCVVDSEEEARAYCKEYNDNRVPCELSIKAEYTEY